MEVLCSTIDIKKLLNLISIVLGAIGFIMLLSYGLPSKYIDPRYARTKPNDPLEERNITREIYENFRDIFNLKIENKGRFGIFLIITGLVLQFILTLLS